MSDKEDTRPGIPSQKRKSSTSMMLFSVLFEQICLDLNIPEGDAYARDAVRRFGMRVFDAGVESAEYALRRERARADHAEAKLRDCERED